MIFNKRGLFFISLLGLVLLLENVYALGVTPAKQEFNFVPGFEKSITYTVFEDNPARELDLYVAGGLAEYVTLDKKTLTGGGSFVATLKLPNSLEIPGKQVILVGVRQKVDPELIQGNIGTAVAIQSPIVVHVPYPGRYVELKLTGHDANVGELINFELDITSKGTEDITITPKMEILSHTQSVGELPFQTRLLRSQDVLQLKKQFDTKGLNPGTYTAVAIVDYGAIAKSQFDFRIGNLSINIINYTDLIPIGKLQPFNIVIESGWNNDIDGVFADVQILNNTQILQSFKTSSSSLSSWEQKTITGYFDSSSMTKGVYNVNITLNYYGKDQKGVTSKVVQVQFFEKPSLVIWFVLGGAGVLIILIIGAIILIKKIKSIKNGTFKKHSKK
ncbi:MAG: hypothetical protein AABW51_04240 [Nanoarchaeota archaeon]